MSAVDRATSERYGVPSLTLMENAGTAVADFAREHWPGANRIVVICGKGNNGGDGLVAARRLHIAGKVVEVVLLARPEELRPDAAAMLARLPLHPIVVENVERVTGNMPRILTGAELIVDAIFGTGYKPRNEASAGQKLAEAAIATINSATAPVLSVDLPSGWDADQCSAANGKSTVCRSDAAITFTAPKPAHLFASLTRGPIVVAAIGTPEEAIVSSQNVYAVTPRDVAALFAPRALDSNKGRFGHVLAVAGSLGKSGAAAMCGMAALRVGAGLVTVATPGAVLPTIAGFAPELMTEELGEHTAAFAAPNDASHCLELAKSRSVLAIGPGLSQRPGVAEFVHRMVRAAHCPVVLDADGLNAFAGSGDPLQGTSRPLILTPHPGEMARLTGQGVAEVQADRVGAARGYARRHRCILVLKGFRTVVAYPDGSVWVAATGNPGMATGGTGDILTGMIAGAVAQFPGHLEEAVRAAVFLHGLAGDVACEQVGEEPLVATDLLQYLPQAFRELRRRAFGKNIRLC
jgi:ADP-dependent NAD(P)H-hydrate dehydratase / NAD(P)H-hydrate epimerase